MPTIIYLHGFASVGPGAKSNALAAVYGSDYIYAPDLPVNPDNVKIIVDNIVRNVANFPLVFVGTSLGGFWANYFAQLYDAPCVIVNPATTPSVNMLGRVGNPVINFKTGELITVTLDDVAKYVECEAEAAEDFNGALVNLFVARDDDVIDCNITLNRMPYTKTCVVTDTGGHRYDTLWNTVVDRVRELAPPKES
jgi:predicted esterase YcpF (UPF0227 family)